MGKTQENGGYAEELNRLSSNFSLCYRRLILIDEIDYNHIPGILIIKHFDW